MSSSALAVSSQQLSSLSSEGEDLSVPVDIFDTYIHTYTLSTCSRCINLTLKL